MLCRRAWQQLQVPSSVIQLGDIGASRVFQAPLPEDHSLVIMLRACATIGAIPVCPEWAVSVISVDFCADQLTQVALHMPELMYAGAAPHEWKGQRVLWEQMIEWVNDELHLERCSWNDWCRRVENTTEHDGAVARCKLLLDSLNHEWSAEFELMTPAQTQGQGIDTHPKRELDAVDEPWSRRVGAAIQASM